MYGHSDSGKMTRRNGSVVKYLVVIVLLLGIVYFIYLHNKDTGRIKETERLAERYRREQESYASQLKGEGGVCWGLNSWWLPLQQNGPHQWLMGYLLLGWEKLWGGGGEIKCNVHVPVWLSNMRSKDEQLSRSCMWWSQINSKNRNISLQLVIDCDLWQAGERYRSGYTKLDFFFTKSWKFLDNKKLIASRISTSKM